jgi:hypothetical protein
MNQWAVLYETGMNIVLKFLVLMDRALQSGWRHQWLCSNDVVHLSVCSPLKKEIVWTIECHIVCANFILEHAMKAQIGDRGIALLFLQPWH